MKIKDIPINERPRERLARCGKENLSNEELISIIFSSGCHSLSVKELSFMLLNEVGDIKNLSNYSFNNLIKIKGIGSAKASVLLASIELGKRVYYVKNKSNVILNSTTKIYEYFKDLFIDLKQEYFYAIYLDTKSKLISYKCLFIGTINMSTVHPREVFKYAISESAYSIIVMHNHPSGDAYPSKMDDELTSSLMQTGKVIGIPVVDHIVFGINSYFSYYESSFKN